MKTSKTRKVIEIFIYILVSLVLYFICKDHFFFTDFTDILIIIYIVLSLIVIQSIIAKVFRIEVIRVNKVIYLTCYGVVLLLSLFYRKTNNTEQFTEPSYIREWIYILFTNKIVFLNIIGNIILFVPLGVYISDVKLNKLLLVLIMISIITILELLQYVTKKGVFDYVDIILNAIGGLIGICLCIRKDIYGRSRQEE